MPNPLLQSNTNQLKELYKMMQNGNPMQVFQQMAMRNPNMQPILNMLNNGANPKDLFYQMCKQKGVNPDDFLKNITG